MKINAIEPTPSPNTMKVILNEELPMGKSNNYKKDNREGAPKVIQDILEIEGVKGVYHVADFLAVERNAKYDWKDLLPQVRNASFVSKRHRNFIQVYILLSIMRMNGLILPFLRKLQKDGGILGQAE